MTSTLHPLLDHSLPSLSITSTLERQCAKYWWVALCCLLSFTCYERTAAQCHREYLHLRIQFEQLEDERYRLLERQVMLHQQLQSQSDPAWVELTLMKVLGANPRGQRKVYFKPASS